MCMCVYIYVIMFCSVLFLIAIYVLFLLFLVRFTSKSRILRVNKESCKLKIDSVLQSLTLKHPYITIQCDIMHSYYYCMNYYSKKRGQNIQTYAFVILYSPFLAYNISCYLTVWSGYNPLLSLECYNHNKHN